LPDCRSGPREILAPNTDENQQASSVEYVQYGVLTPVLDGKFHGAEDPLTKSEEELGEAMIKMLTDEKLLTRLKEESKQRVKEFDINNIIKEWEFLSH